MIDDDDGIESEQVRDTCFLISVGLNVLLLTLLGVVAAW